MTRRRLTPAERQAAKARKAEYYKLWVARNLERRRAINREYSRTEKGLARVEGNKKRLYIRSGRRWEKKIRVRSLSDRVLRIWHLFQFPREFLDYKKITINWSLLE